MRTGTPLSEDIDRLLRDFPWAAFQYGDVTQALARLAVDPMDSCGLLVLYDKHLSDFRKSVVRWIKRDSAIRSRAVISVLLGVAKHAREYDPRTMNAGDWIRDSAETEARRLGRWISSRR